MVDVDVMYVSVCVGGGGGGCVSVCGGNITYNQPLK